MLNKRVRTWTEKYQTSNPSKLTSSRHQHSLAVGGSGVHCPLPYLPELPDVGESYYVYVLLDTRTKSRKYKEVGHEPFYVGLGKKSRCLQHFKSYFKRKSLKNNLIKKIIDETGDWPKIKILRSGLTLSEAQDLEIQFIAAYGRRDKSKGPLANHTDGGEGFVGHCIKLSPPTERKRIAKIRETFLSKTDEEKRLVSSRISEGTRIGRAKSTLKEQHAENIRIALTTLGSDSWASFVREHGLAKDFRFSKYESATSPMTCTCKACKTNVQTTPQRFRWKVLHNKTLCSTCHKQSESWKTTCSNRGAAIKKTYTDKYKSLWADKNAEYRAFIKTTNFIFKKKIECVDDFYAYQEHICRKCKCVFKYIPQRLFAGKIVKVHSC